MGPALRPHEIRLGVQASDIKRVGLDAEGDRRMLEIAAAPSPAPRNRDTGGVDDGNAGSAENVTRCALRLVRS